MDFQLPADDDPRRLAIREWLAAHPEPTGEELAEAGYVAPHWPPPWGLGADPIHQLIIDDELSRAKVRVPMNPIGIGLGRAHASWSAARRRRRTATCGRCCPAKSSGASCSASPASGSDLANLGTRAVRDGDEFVVNGQKIWTTRREHADVRHPHRPHRPRPAQAQGHQLLHLPDGPARHRGAPDHRDDRRAHFNEVFFTDVRIPAENLVGDLNDGWRLAKVTLGNERVSLSTGGVLWGNGPTGLELIDSIRDLGPCDRPALRQRIASVYTEHVLLDLIRMRTLSAALKGKQPGPEASIRKLLADEHGQHVMALARDCIGAAGMLTGGDGERVRARHRHRGARTEQSPADGLMHAELVRRVHVQPGAHHRRRHVRRAAQHHRRAGAGPAARRRCHARVSAGPRRSDVVGARR